MLFNWFDHPLIEAWLERQLSFSPKLPSATTRPRRFGRLLEMIDRNHLGPLCVARMREGHHQTVVG